MGLIKAKTSFYGLVYKLVSKAKHIIFSLCFALLIPVTALFCQNTQLKVVDAVSMESLPSAHIKLFRTSDQKNLFTTNAHGILEVEIQHPTNAQFTFIGYDIHEQLVYPGRMQTIKLSPKVNRTDEVVITGEYEAIKAEKSLQSVQIIGADEIEQRGSTRLNDVLEMELNSVVNTDNTLGSQLSLNGLDGEQVLILQDGVPLTGRQGGFIDLDQISVENLEKVEIVDGPMSAQFGSDAIGGVVNLISKHNREKAQFNLHTQYETVGEYYVGLNGGFKLKNHSFYLHASRNFFDGYDSIPVREQRNQLWNPKEQYTAGLNYQFSSGRNRLRVNTSWLKEKLINRGNGIGAASILANDIHYRSNRPQFSANYKRIISDNSYLRINGGYSAYSRLRNLYQKNLVSLDEEQIGTANDHDTSQYHIVNIKTIYGVANTNKKLTAEIGADFRHEWVFAERIARQRADMSDMAFFGSMLIKLSKKISLKPQVRILYNTDFVAPLIPSLNARFELTEKQIFRASYGLGYRAPSLKELYLEFVDINHNIFGNEDLKAELGHYTEISHQFINTASKWKPKVESKLFYNNVSNNISLFQTTAEQVGGPTNGGNDLFFTYQNVASYSSAGLRISMALSWNDFTTGAGIQFIQSFMKLNDTLQTASASTITANLKLGYYLDKLQLNFSVLYKYLGTQPVYYIENNKTEVGEIDPYHLMQLNLNKSFLDKRLSVQLSVRNLFDVTTVRAPSFDASGAHTANSSAVVGYGRTYLFGLKYKLLN